MEEIGLCLKVLTPMFLGGADRTRCELRAASVRGQLRFWWRAQRAHLSPEDLRQKEGDIFGSAGDRRACKSSFSLLLAGEELKFSREPLPWNDHVRVRVERSSGREVSASLLEYLAYGTFEWDRDSKRNVLLRDYIAPGSRFRVVLRFRDPAQMDEVLKALHAFCLFGTLGARARNGYGSFKIIGVEGPEVAKKVLAVQVPDREVMEELCAGSGVPPFSAFCRGARLFKTRGRCDSWDRCLAELARAYREARLSLERRHAYGRRQYVGAPIVVEKEQVSVMDRRAKPYFLRVHLEKGGYVGYVLYLPSQYLPPRYHPGLGIDREKYPKTDSQREEHEKAFRAVCEDMNKKLAEQLEVVF